MLDFSNISIIIHCRIDNEERAKNAGLIYNFYKNTTSNSQIIFVEDDIDSKLLSHISIRDEDKYDPSPHRHLDPHESQSSLSG